MKTQAIESAYYATATAGTVEPSCTSLAEGILRRKFGEHLVKQHIMLLRIS